MAFSRRLSSTIQRKRAFPTIIAEAMMCVYRLWRRRWAAFPWSSSMVAAAYWFSRETRYRRGSHLFSSAK
jgi:hypothetical protein